MSSVGYARVSTIDQDLSLQLDALKNAGCKKIFSEKISANTKTDRTKLRACLGYLREGDTLIVTRIDRLSRSLRDLQNLIYDLKDQGIYLKATEQPIDTSTSAGKAFLDMLGVFAEFETNLRRERQLEGIAKAKKAGKYKGRQPTARAKSNRVVDLISKGFTRQSVAKTLDIGIASVYRILKTHKLNNPTIALPGSRSRLKIALLEVHLSVENNSKFVRGKKKVRQDIEEGWKGEYDMVKLEKNGWNYRLKVPYSSMEALEKTIYAMMSDADSRADLKNCFVEMTVTHRESNQSW